MEEKAGPLNDNNLRLIRNSVEKLTIQSDLRRRFIGGISEEDVARYIDSVRQQFQLIEDELKQNIKVLQDSKDEMRREFDSNMKRTMEEKARLQENLEKALADSSVYMNQCNEIKNSFESKVEELEKQLQESRKMAEEYREAYKTMEQKFKGEQENIKRALEEKVNLNSRVMGFKSKMEAIYKQLSTLNEQVDINDDLQQQLELERMRADKAEKELSQFGELVSGLKDRFHKDQEQLEVQLTEIEKNQKVIQSDINGLRTNLENFCMDRGTEIDDLCATVENTYQLFDRK